MSFCYTEIYQVKKKLQEDLADMKAVNGFGLFIL
jgi:hypothetical protein